MDPRVGVKKIVNSYLDLESSESTVTEQRKMLIALPLDADISQTHLLGEGGFAVNQFSAVYNLGIVVIRLYVIVL